MDGKIINYEEVKKEKISLFVLTDLENHRLAVFTEQ